MKKILYVEDNDVNHLLVKEILSKYDIDLARACDGKEFFEKIKKPARFDLILMDLMLPDTNGIELTKYLINEGYKIPIIFISAYSEKCEEVYDLGIEYFISKPVMPELLISVIKKFIPLNKTE